MINKKFLIKVSMILLLFLLIGFWADAAGNNKIVIGVQNEPGTLDPHRLDSRMARKVMNFIFDQLIWIHPETNEFIPGLAESWEVSEDGLVITFHLREGVKFHDGSPLTAEDFKYTYERALDPATNATFIRTDIGPLERVEVVDELTFKLIYRGPYATALYNAAIKDFTPINRKSVEAQGEEFGTNPVGAGTGPYKFKNWEPGQYITVVRNEDYNWGPEFYENQGPPHIEEIEFRFIPELEVQTMALLSEEIDSADYLPAKDVAALKAHPNIFLYEQHLPGMGLYSAFNVAKPPFDDPLVRKAASHAVDKQAIINVVKIGQATVGHGPFPFFWFGFNEKIEDYYGYDPELTKKMLDEAGWKVGPDGIRQKDGVRLAGDFMVRHRDDYINSAQMIQEMFKKVGIGLEIQILEWGALMEAIWNGKHHYTLMGHGGGDPESVIYAYFHSDNIGGWNLAQISDENLDELIEKIRVTMDIEKRREMLEEFQEIVMIEKTLWIPIYNDIEYDPVNTRIQGTKFHPFMWILPNDARIVE